MKQTENQEINDREVTFTRKHHFHSRSEHSHEKKIDRKNFDVKEHGCRLSRNLPISFPMSRFNIHVSLKLNLRTGTGRSVCCKSSMVDQVIRGILQVEILNHRHSIYVCYSTLIVHVTCIPSNFFFQKSRPPYHPSVSKDAITHQDVYEINKNAGSSHISSSPQSQTYNVLESFYHRMISQFD